MANPSVGDALEILAQAEPDLRIVNLETAVTRHAKPWPGMGAAKQRPGMHVLPSLELGARRAVTERIQNEKQPGDIVVASIHWGGNWGYFVPPDQRAFAGDLVRAGADVIHGHSSHHAKGIEVMANRPVIYGCGDLLNDYEGIESVHGRYRSELVLMYFVTLDADTGELQRLAMRPLRIRHFRLNRAAPEEVAWLSDTMHREGQNLNTTVETGGDGFLHLHWHRGGRG